MASDFENHVELEVVARIECIWCPNELEIEQDIDWVTPHADSISEATDAADKVQDSAQKLAVQAELKHWELSDLGGKLDGIYPCCDDCMKSYRKGTLE